MKVVTTFLEERHEQKPSGAETARIQNQCVHAEKIELSKLLEVITMGGTFRPTECGKNAYSFKSGQLFALDFDNTDAHRNPLPQELQTMPEQAIAIAKDAGYRPYAMYHTFSSSPQQPKFRLLFVADKPITDRNQWKHCQAVISEIYPEDVTDHTDNSNRLFFGTDKGIAYTDETAVVSTDKLLTGYVAPQEAHRKERTATRQSRTRSGKRASRVVDAIRNRDANYIRRSQGYTRRTTFNNRSEFYDYIYREISLAELLGVDAGTAFRCVLPTHGTDDDNPSASVFRSSGGTWLYKCFAEDKKLNIKQLVELLGAFKSEHAALEFIKDAFNLKIKQSAWSVEQLANIDSILDSLLGTDENAFSVICPTAAVNIRNCKALFVHLLMIAKKAIYPERSSDDGNIIFYASARQLAKALDKKSTERIGKYLKVLEYHGLIEELPNERIPPQFLKKAIENKTSEQHNRISFFSIPSWVVQQTQLIEDQGQRWKANGYRMNGISYELFLRTEGAEVANRLYPQTAHYVNKAGQKVQRNPTKRADGLHNRIADVVIGLIDDKGYCTEAEVAKILAKTEGKTVTDLQIKRSISDIMNCNNLCKVKANKALKLRLSIDCKGYPNIIVPV